MPPTHTHLQLYEDLKHKGFCCHGYKYKGIDQRWVCLTGPNTQKKGTRKRTTVCFILYGPNNNYAPETGVVHCKRDFWDDIPIGKEKEIRFHEEAYELFGIVQEFLEYKRAKSDVYKRIKSTDDWIWCDVKNWKAFASKVRSFNKM